MSFDTFALILGSSKYDFWNLWKISDRSWYFFFKKVFFSKWKKNLEQSEKNIFWDFSKKKSNLEKICWENLFFQVKILLGKINFPNKIFRDSIFFPKNLKKYFFQIVRDFFFHFEKKKLFSKKNIKIDPKISKDSKNHT